MALVSGRGSTLNPNARPFIPAAYRQVDDLSSDWWNLSSSRNHFLSERDDDEEVSFVGSNDDDITRLLPDTFDVDYDVGAGAGVGDFFKSSETYEHKGLRTEIKLQDREISGIYGGALMMNSLNMYSLPSNRMGINTLVEPPKSIERPTQWFSPSNGLRHIHQMR